MISYLESFERINFFGEDAEDVLSAGRPHTPVGGGTFPTHVPPVAASGVCATLKQSVFYDIHSDKFDLSYFLCHFILLQNHYCHYFGYVIPHLCVLPKTMFLEGGRRLCSTEFGL